MRINRPGPTAAVYITFFKSHRSRFFEVVGSAREKIEKGRRRSDPDSVVDGIASHNDVCTARRCICVCVCPMVREWGVYNNNKRVKLCVQIIWSFISPGINNRR